MTVETDVIAGRFELTGPPLKGGMGVLYRERDRRITNRVVAIKMLLDGANDADLRRRFEQEASAAGGLNHENIVRIFDVGEHQGIPFIVMEFVDGETLASVIARRETIDLARTLGWCDSLCDGLSYAHHAGIVHRDIKPANLMIERRRGTLKILDFGIARIRSGATVGGTLTGTMIGTLNYMSPEQARGDPSVDHRSDIFSVGSVIYELLSHRQAFPGQEPYAAMHRIQHEAVAPLSHVRPGVPVALERLVARALEKDATRRFQRLEDMVEGLRAIRASLDGDADHLLLDESDESPLEPPVSSVTQQVRELLSEARASAARGVFAAAESMLQKVLLLESGHTEARKLLAEAQDAIAERHRKEEAARVLESGARQKSAGKWTAAYKCAQQALELDPLLTRARALRDEAEAVLRERRQREELDRCVPTRVRPDADAPANSSGRWMWAAVAASLLACGIVAAFLFARPALPTQVSDPSPVAVVPIATTIPDPQPLPGPQPLERVEAPEPRTPLPTPRSDSSVTMRRVRIDVHPWAELSLTPVGTDRAVPIRAVSPVAVNLRDGTYSVTLRNPALGSGLSARLTVSEQNTTFEFTLPGLGVETLLDELLAEHERDEERTGIRAFLQGRYSAAVSALTRLAYGGTLSPLGRLFLACSYAAVAIIDDSTGEGLELARAHYRQAMGGGVRPDRRLVSPRIVTLLEGE